MAEAQRSLSKNSSSIDSIQKSLNSFGKSLRVANSTSSVIIKQLSDGNKDKKAAILKKTELFQKRREAVRRREQEDLIESGKVTSISSSYARGSKLIASSTKGFLGRIMDFVGTIMVGWLVSNLPNIIKGAQKLGQRIQEVFNTLVSWKEGLFVYFSDFTSFLQPIKTSITGNEFEDDQSEAKKTSDKVDVGLQKIQNELYSMYETVRDFDILKMLGLSPAANAGGMSGGGTSGGGMTGGTAGGGRLKPLLNLISSGESPGGGYTAMFPSESHPQILNMTINEVVAFQKEKLKDGRRSAAIGRYQMLYPEKFAAAAGLPLTAKFTPENQDKMVIAYLKQNRRLDEWLQGKITDAQFSEELAREFGAFKSASGYVLPGNTGSIGFDKLKPVLQQIKSSPATTSGEYRGGTYQTPSGNINIDPNKRIKVGTRVGDTVKSDFFGSMAANRTRPHGGADYACDPGTYIACKLPCKVVEARWQRGYGYYTDIIIPNLSIRLRFAHLSQQLITSGDVPAGTPFARSGNTGRSTGPHIHMEATANLGGTSYGGDFSPDPYVDAMIFSKNPPVAGTGGGVLDTIKRNLGIGGPSLEPVPSQTDVARQVTPERKGQVITVPIPMGGEAPPAPTPAPQGESPISIPTSDNTLNSFVTQTLLRELEYT